MTPWRFPGLALCFAVAACLSGCIGERPTGDFGRPAPSVLHDSVFPAIGNQFASIRQEPVSGFNLTDKERELRDRAWTLVRPPHAADWLGQVIAEGQRTRILPELDTQLSKDRYYSHLRSDRFRSSEARYSRVISDIETDKALIRPYCELAYQVRAIDDERLRAVNARVHVDPQALQHAYDRVQENQRLMTWVWRSVKYRALSYEHAIDSLELETPSRQLFETNHAWRRFLGTIGYCEAGPHGRNPYARGVDAKRSRVVADWRPAEAPAPQK